MRHIGLWLAATLAFYLTACVPTTPPQTQSCEVSHVVDGDTLHLTCNGMLHKVRLLGYDTPEIYHPLCPAERVAGEQATNLMRALVASGPVTLFRIAGQDRYGRDLVTLQIAGRDVATYMLSQPLARPYQGHKHPDWCRILAP